MDKEDERTSSLLRQYASRHRPDDALRAAIRTSIAVAEAGRAPDANARPRDGARLRWGAALAGFAAGILATLLVVAGLNWRDSRLPTEAEIVARHVHALQVGPLIEVASTDRHVVKPWYQGRLDFAPTVFDLAAEGFKLVGGRVEHVQSSAVAALAYKRDLHVINVFAWPSAATEPSRSGVERGFNLVRWSAGGMQYWVVSDLERRELERFAALWQARAAQQ